MIVDGFLFNDELDLLELRLMELGDLVDRFVLVESPWTFQQTPKPMHYEENIDRFARWADKIHRYEVHTLVAPHPVIEHASRRSIANGFEDLDIGDVIMMGDVDEIPSREVVERLRRTPPARPLVCKQHLYYYRVTNHAGFWNGTIVMPRGLGKIDLQELRDQRNFLIPIDVDPAGWHFSWLGDAADVSNKLRCIDVYRDSQLYKGHESLPKIPDPDTDAEFVERAVTIGDDLFGRKTEFTTVPVYPGQFQPHSIESWLKGKEKYGVAE